MTKTEQDRHKRAIAASIGLLEALRSLIPSEVEPVTRQDLYAWNKRLLAVIDSLGAEYRQYCYETHETR